MDKIAETKKKMRLKEWTKTYAGYQLSEKTVTAWCEGHGLSTKTFYYRFRKIREKTLEQPKAIRKYEKHKDIV